MPISRNAAETLCWASTLNLERAGSIMRKAVHPRIEEDKAFFYICSLFT